MKFILETKSVVKIILSCLFCLMPSLSHGKEISVPSSIKTIHEAVSVAQSGDTIVVDNGEYLENILIDKALTLKSKHGPEKTIIKAREPGKPILRIENVKSVYIEGFSLQGSKGVAISVYKSSDCRFYGNTISNNDRGFFLESSNNNNIENNVVTHNREGIRLTSSQFNTLNKNKVDSNSEKGIILLDSDKNRIINNTANSNYWNGITLWNSRHNLIKDNTVVKNTYAIILGDSDNNELSGNRTMRRLYLILPIFLVYIGISLYLVEKKLFIRYYSPKSR